MQLSLVTVLSLLAVSVAAAPSSDKPRPPGKYRAVFKGQDCATQAPDYLTSSSEKTLKDCTQFCDSVKGCNFVNYYQDLGSSKPGLGVVYTCALFAHKHTEKDNTNCGGQSQVFPFKNTIKNSSGYRRDWF